MRKFKVVDPCTFKCDPFAVVKLSCFGCIFGLFLMLSKILLFKRVKAEPESTNALIKKGDILISNEHGSLGIFKFKDKTL